MSTCRIFASYLGTQLPCVRANYGNQQSAVNVLVQKEHSSGCGWARSHFKNVLKSTTSSSSLTWKSLCEYINTKLSNHWEPLYERAPKHFKSRKLLGWDSYYHIFIIFCKDESMCELTWKSSTKPRKHQNILGSDCWEANLYKKINWRKIQYHFQRMSVFTWRQLHP